MSNNPLRWCGGGGEASKFGLPSLADVGPQQLLLPVTVVPLGLSLSWHFGWGFFGSDCFDFLFLFFGVSCDSILFAFFHLLFSSLFFSFGSFLRDLHIFSWLWFFWGTYCRY